MWNVVPAVKVVIDEYLPVTVNVIRLAREILQVSKTEWCDTLHDSAQKVRQRACFRIKIHKDQRLPCIHVHRNQTVILALKILYTIELRHPLERPVQPIVPTVIWTMQNRGDPALFSDHRCGMMAADVVKRS